MTRRKTTSPMAPPCVGCQFDPMHAGRLEGKLDSIHEAVTGQGVRLESMDSRLRQVENRSAIAGAAGGLVMALGVNLAAWWLKGKS